MSSEAERGGRRWRALRDRLLSFKNTHQAITRHWPNVVLMLCRHRRRQASIRTTLGQCLVFARLRSQLIRKKLSHWHNVSLMVAHHLQHWAGISPALAYQYICLNKINIHPMLDDGTTFNQHWVSAGQKEAVTSAERRYILDLQVSKYGLFEETGRQLKSSKCLVYQGADIAFWHCTNRTDSSGS